MVPFLTKVQTKVQTNNVFHMKNGLLETTHCIKIKEKVKLTNLYNCIRHLENRSCKYMQKLQHLLDTKRLHRTTESS